MQKKASVEESNKTLVVVLVITGIILILGLLVGYLLHNYYSDNDGSGVVVNETKVTQPVVNETPTVTNQTPLTTNQTANQTTTATGGSGGGTTTPTCTDTCSSLGFECGNWSVCGSVVDCGICGSGFECISGECVELVNCTSDIDCGYLSGVCGIGLCNLSLNECYTSYNLTTDVCRESGFECDAAEYCSGGGVDCPADVNESEGTICSRGSCSGGVCQVISANTFYVSVTGAGSHDGSLGNEMNLSDAQAYANAHTDEEITFLLEGGEYGDFTYDANLNERTNWVRWNAQNPKTVSFSLINVWNPLVQDCYMGFDGVTINHTGNGNGVYFGRCNNVELKNMDIVGDGWVTNDDSAGIKLKASSHVLIDTCHIYGEGETPIKGLSDIEGYSPEGFATSFDLGVTYAGGADYNHDVTVNNCEIQGCDKGVHIFGKNWTVTNNHIYNLTTDGIVLSWANNPGVGERTLIANNHIHDNHYWEGWSGHPDGIQMNDATNATSHIIIKNNIIHNIYGNGMFLRPNAFAESPNTDWVIENNLIYDTSDGSDYALRIFSGTDIVFRNNTIIGDKAPDGRATGQLQVQNENIDRPVHFLTLSKNIMEYISLQIDTPPPVIIDEEDYNLIYRAWAGMNSYVFGENTIIFGSTDYEGFTNIFVDYDNSDYHPLINSPACNGSINPVGVAVGALPCVCTQDSQCVEVFGSGSVCNLQTQKCEGGLGTHSFHKSSFFSVIWQWVKSLFS